MAHRPYHNEVSLTQNYFAELFRQGLYSPLNRELVFGKEDTARVPYTLPPKVYI